MSFSTPKDDDSARNLPVLDITMVPEQKASAPEDPDYLANANQEGRRESGRRPPAPATTVHPPVREQSAAVPVLTRKKSDRTTHKEVTEIPPSQPTLSAAQLIERGIELVGMSSQLAQDGAAGEDRLKHTYISSRTRRYMYANYMASWVAKVERVGNLNYPDEARRKGLSGTLLLDVALNSDGSILKISLLRSSGHQALDDAAVRIVKLAAPFSPFPPEIKKDTDVLHVTRTWEFLKNNRLHGR